MEEMITVNSKGSNPPKDEEFIPTRKVYIYIYIYIYKYTQIYNINYID